jgi:uncharacterized paraquat-inducible protein A
LKINEGYFGICLNQDSDKNIKAKLEAACGRCKTPTHTRASKTLQTTKNVQ